MLNTFYFLLQNSKSKKMKDYSLLIEALLSLRGCSVIKIHANELDMKLTNTKLMITYSNFSLKNSFRYLLNVIKNFMCES